MIAAEIVYFLVGGTVLFLLGLFCASSIIENKYRAASIGFGLLIIIGLLWYYGFSVSNYASIVPIAISLIILIAGLTLFLPVGRKGHFDYGGANKKVDERDTMFAREEYESGSEKYQRYYAVHPEYKEIDDKIRKLPRLLSPGGRYFNEHCSGLIQSFFNQISRLTTQVDGSINPDKIKAEPLELSQIIKDIAIRLGADEVGIAKLNPMYIYSHIGRGPEEWGRPIVNNHKFAIVFTLEMNYYRVEEAPKLGITEEAARQYYNAALLSTSLAAAIRGLGYPARAHISDSNYQIMLPPVAVDAGLGELGRIGYLISRKFGARVRLGGVTTDLPLVPDKPIEFGVQYFCEICKKCAANCPSNAIPDGDRLVIRGIDKWPLNVEKCLTYWRSIGTDCGLCMKVCPFSHPPTIIHNLVRAGIKNSSFARYVSVYADDLLYGQKTREMAK